MSSNPKKWILMLFAIKSSFKFPAVATPNKADRVMEDWWRMTSLQEYLEPFCFYFACLTAALLRQLHFVCLFCRGKLLTTTETTVTWTRRISWFLTWRRDQEIIKVRKWIPPIGPLTKVIRLKLFLDIVPSSSEDITRAMRGQPKRLSRITWEKWRERHFICFGFVS